MNAKKFDGWVKFKVAPVDRVELATGCTVEEECFSLLSYFAETQDEGVAFIRSLGHRRPKEIFFIFQSYIRQANSFFNSAKNLHYRSSALLYYYSFLNLAKAYLTLKNPRALPRKPKHGINSPIVVSNFKNQQIGISSDYNEVFPILYKQLTNHPIPPKKLNIYRLLGYCRDISYENRMIGSQWNSTIPARVAILVDSQRNQSWPIFALPKSIGLFGYRKSMEPFMNYFQPVDFPLDEALKVFEMYAPEASHYDFFECRSEYPLARNGLIQDYLIRRDLYSVIKDLYISEPTKQDFEFSLSVPLRRNLQKPFNEILAIYVIMFFIGSLVRYNPRHLEKMLSKKEAWLIERFVSSCPKRILRHFTNLILNKDHVFYSN